MATAKFLTGSIVLTIPDKAVDPLDCPFCGTTNGRYGMDHRSKAMYICSACRRLYQEHTVAPPDQPVPPRKTSVSPRPKSLRIGRGTKKKM
jgi:transposase-like protein